MSRATFSFVPTPSVPLTSSGSAMSLAAAMENSPPKPPMSPTTSGRYVSCTTPLMASTARAPSAVSTPACAYVAASSSIQLGIAGPSVGSGPRSTADSLGHRNAPCT